MGKEDYNFYQKESATTTEQEFCICTQMGVEYMCSGLEENVGLLTC
jgi:hypothetical protein